MFPLVASVFLCSQRFEPQQFLQQAVVPVSAAALRHQGRGGSHFPCSLGRDILCCLLSSFVSPMPFLQPHQFCAVPENVATCNFFLCCWLDSFDFSSKGSGNLLPQSRLTVIFTCTSTEIAVTAEEAGNSSFQLKLALCKSLCPLLSQGSHFPMPPGVQSLGSFNKLKHKPNYSFSNLMVSVDLYLFRITYYMTHLHQ